MNFIKHVLEPRRLLLVWQGPDGSRRRTRYAVAELIRMGDEQVRFQYLVDTAEFRAAQEEGFVGFPAFRKIDQCYDLGVVDTFSRRLPPSSRGDFAEYLKLFRLTPDIPISDFALLAYTGAKLPSDGFSIIDPLQDVERAGELMIEVAGFRHLSTVQPNDLRVGEPVQFVHEPANPQDPNALAVVVQGHKIGYVPRQQAVAVRQHYETGNLTAAVERINGSSERPLVYLLAEVQPLTAKQTLAS